MTRILKDIEISSLLLYLFIWLGCVLRISVYEKWLLRENTKENKRHLQQNLDMYDIKITSLKSFPENVCPFLVVLRVSYWP